MLNKLKQNYLKLTPLLLLFFFLIPNSADAGCTVGCTAFFEAKFSGGVTGAGYSPAWNAGGTGTITTAIPAGASIFQAYLLAGRFGNASNLTVTLDGVSLTFNAGNQASNTFQSVPYGGNSGVHAIDLNPYSATLLSAGNTHTLVVPNQAGPANRYSDFYLYIAYYDPLYPEVATAILLNSTNFGSSITHTYTPLAPFMAPFSGSPTALAAFAGYVCDIFADGEKVSVNGTNLTPGTLGWHDINSGFCGGPVGSFNYSPLSGGIITGLSDDNENQTMGGFSLLAGPEALSDIRIPLGFSPVVSAVYTTTGAGNNSNATWASILAWVPQQPLGNSAPSSLVTEPASNITSNSATLNGVFNNPGTYTPSCAYGCAYFLWGTSPTALNQNASVGPWYPYGTFSKALTGLNSNVNYYYKACAQNIYGSNCGTVGQFKTQ